MTAYEALYHLKWFYRIINQRNVVVSLCYQVHLINLVVWFVSSQMGLEYG